MDRTLNRLTSPHDLRLMSYDPDKHADDGDRLAKKHRGAINTAGVIMMSSIAIIIGYVATDRNNELPQRIVEALFKSTLGLIPGWAVAAAAITAIVFVRSLPRR